MLLQLVSNKLKPILVAQRQRSWSDIYGYLESLSPPRCICVKDSIVQ